MKMPQHRHQQYSTKKQSHHGNVRDKNNGDDIEVMRSTNERLENITNGGNIEKTYSAAPMRLIQ
jgi:hypothetical protein